MTIELEGHSFCLPATQIENVGKEQFVTWLLCDANSRMLCAAMCYVELQICVGSSSSWGTFCLAVPQWIKNDHVSRIIEAGVKALAAFIRQHGGEPSAQVGIFAPGSRLNGESAIFGSIKLYQGLQYVIISILCIYIYTQITYQDHSGWVKWVKLWDDSRLQGNGSTALYLVPANHPPVSRGWLITAVVRHSDLVVCCKKQRSDESLRVFKKGPSAGRRCDSGGLCLVNGDAELAPCMQLQLPVEGRTVACNQCMPIQSLQHRETSLHSKIT